MLDLTGQPCQGNLYHVSPRQAAILRAAGLDDSICDHGWPVTGAEGLPYLLEEVPLPTTDTLEAPTVTELSQPGLVKLNSAMTSELYRNGRLVGPPHDDSVRHAIRDHILGKEPPEPVVERIRAADAPEPVTASLLLAEEGPVVGADPAAPTLVSGPAKAGKTTVVAGMLGARRAVSAVWIAGEGKKWTWHQLHRSGAHRATIYDLPVGKSITKTAELVAEDAPELAVLDPYGIAASVWGYDTNHDTTASAILRRVQEIVGPIPVIIIAHDRKSGEQDRSGPLLDRPRGSSALVGLCSVIHRVTTAGDGRSQVRTIGYRYGPTPPPWTFDLAAGKWLAAPAGAAKAERILVVLEAADAPVSCRQIGSELGGGRAGRVTVRELERLAAEGLTHKAGSRNGAPLWAFGAPPVDTLL